MARKCSQCGNNGHNSRTCNNPRLRSSVGSGCGGGLKLFGVHLHVVASPMKKSFSIDYLSSSSNYHPSPCASSPSSSPSSSLVSIDETIEKGSSGYLSDDLMGRTQERKKGVPWTEEEHKTFLIGLEKLGKGDWRGISRSFVTTRTPTQVASHAQKHFLRQNTLNKKMHQSTLFDMSTFQVGNCDSFNENTKVNQVNNNSEPDLTITEQVPFSYIEEPQFQPPFPNLELSISCSRSWDQNKSSPRSLFM